MRFIAPFIVFCTWLISVSATTPQSTDFSQKSKPATIKVLLYRQAPHLVLEAKGRHFIFNPLDGVRISSGSGTEKHPVTTEEWGIVWGDAYKSHQLRWVPGDSQSSLLVNGIQYRGCIEIYHNDGKFNVINEIDIESYLKSTLTAEFPSPSNDEVMNSLAIVARTNAYFVSSRHGQAYWHVIADEVGYQGAAMLPKPHVDKAVETTRHAILTYQGSPFPATWTQNSAGKTVDFAAIFRKAITTPPGVETPLAAKVREQSKWSCAIAKSFLASATDLTRVTGLDLYVAPQSEKVYAVKVSGETQVKDFDFGTFQRILGPNRLRSNDFKVAIKGDELIFTGYGEGPGVGLCLFSAKALAEKGEKAPQILEVFFPQTTLQKEKSLRW